MEVFTEEILWHGGGMTNGKAERVFSVDMHPSGVLATTGFDGNAPPQGCARIWKFVGDKRNKPECLTQFNDHQSDCHVARFSPCGKWLATASDRTIVCYKVESPDDWLLQNDKRRPTKVWLSTSLTEIYDVQWSPDSKYLLAGSINTRAEILEVEAKVQHNIAGSGHSHYVQGVAWDPLNEMIATQSADRSCRVYFIKRQKKKKKGQNARAAAEKSTTAGTAVKFKGAIGVIKMVYSDTTATIDAATGVPGSVVTGGEDTEDAASSSHLPPLEKKVGTHLYADSTVESFFRRPAFSPDGALLVTPTGLHKVEAADGKAHTSFATHIFSRKTLKAKPHHPHPTVTLAGLEDPSVAVSFSPLLYKLVGGEDAPSLFKGAYRMVFAVATTSTIFIYDTQHARPLARLGGLHCTNINDVAWSADGTQLFCCSSDGYVSQVNLSGTALGERMSDDDHMKFLTEMRSLTQQPVRTDGTEGGAEEDDEDDDEEEDDEGNVDGTNVTADSDEPMSVPPPPGGVTRVHYDVAGGGGVPAINVLKLKKRVQAAGMTSPAPSKSTAVPAATSSEKKRRITPQPVPPTE
jgi:chromatin assembly factor 1 subunit B